MVPAWLVPLAGLLLAVAALLAGPRPAGERPSALSVVYVILVVAAVAGFGAATVIALTAEG